MIEQNRKVSFNEDEQKQLEKIKNSFPTTSSLIQRTSSYYLEFKTSTPNIPSDQILLAMKCAFFMAEKSQIMQNIKGQKIRGIGLSLNNLIKSHKSDQVMFMLKQLYKKITIRDQQASNQIKNIVQEISLLIKFSDKFQKIMTKLQIKSKSNNSNYENIFSSLAWLLFVEAKNHIFHLSQQIVQNTCLLSHTISFMIIFGWNFIKPQFFYKGDPKLTQNSSQKQVSIAVKNKLFQMFKISNFHFYELVAQQFQDFFHKKIQKGIIKHSSICHFLSPQIIQTNYKKLDQFYNKNMDPNCLDHRIFFKERAAILTPSRFTPFGKQGYLTKGVNKGRIGQLNVNDRSKDNYTSHRVLTYQNFDRIENIDNKNTSYNQMTKFPKNIIHSPSTVSIPLIQTPLAAGMEMYNYLNNKSKRFNQKSSQLSQSDFIIMSYIDKFFSKQKKAKTIQEIKKKLVFSLFKSYLSQFSETCLKQVCSQIEQALLALIIEMVCFVNNIHLQFCEIQSELQLSVYHEWKICDFLLKNDRAMPIALKAHILDLEVSFVTQRIWQQEDIVQEIQLFFKVEKANSPLRHKIQKLCTRIVFQIAFQINQISNDLKVTQQFSEKVFQVLKNLLEEHIELYQYRFIDQLILCAFYLIAKIQKSPCTLSQIKQAYIQMNPHNVKDHQKLLSVNTPQLQDSPTLNLVQFYNKCFLHYAKNCLKNESNQSITHVSNNQYKDSNQVKLLLQSPLKTIIPRQTNMLNKNYETTQGNKNKTKSHLTPQLYAYTESPLLKNNCQAFNGNKFANNSRKVLDYEKQEAKIIQKCNNKGENNADFPQNNSNVDQFFNKKFKQPSSSQKSNIQNIQPKNLTNQPSRGNSFVEQKTTLLKPGLFANIQNQNQIQIQNNPYHLNIK